MKSQDIFSYIGVPDVGKNEYVLMVIKLLILLDIEHSLLQGCIKN